MNDKRTGTAIVTGASAGIGAQYAEQLAQRGYDLVLVARNRTRMDALSSRISGEFGGSVKVVEADLGTDAGVSAVERLLAADASVTMLVNNAGIGSISPPLESSLASMLDIIAVNVTALTRLTMAATHAFAARGAGDIVQISSVVAIKPEWVNAVYAASKSYVLAYSQSLRENLAAKGIRVQVVLPGTTSTEFWDAVGRPTASLPPDITMTAKQVVAAALAGLDLGEFVTIPSLPALADWATYDDARNALAPNLSRNQPAARYRAVG